MVVVGVVVVIIIIIITTITLSKGTGNGLNVGEFIPYRSGPQEFRSSYKMCRNKTGNVRINVKFRRVLATTVAVEKQQVLHNLRVCL